MSTPADVRDFNSFCFSEVHRKSSCRTPTEMNGANSQSTWPTTQHNSYDSELLYACCTWEERISILCKVINRCSVHVTVYIAKHASSFTTTKCGGKQYSDELCSEVQLVITWCNATRHQLTLMLCYIGLGNFCDVFKSFPVSFKVIVLLRYGFRVRVRDWVLAQYIYRYTQNSSENA